jgi:hypothetical protein
MCTYSVVPSPKDSDTVVDVCFVYPGLLAFAYLYYCQDKSMIQQVIAGDGSKNEIEPWKGGLGVELKITIFGENSQITC